MMQFQAVAKKTIWEVIYITVSSLEQQGDIIAHQRKTQKDVVIRNKVYVY